MSRRVTISLPDDVAEQLAAIPPRQVSAYVTEALRRRRVSDELRAALSAAGHREYPYDPKGRGAATGEPADHARGPGRPPSRDSPSPTGRPIEEVRAELSRRAVR